MDLPIPVSIPHPDKIYYREVLHKKEARKTWTEYYAALCDHHLIFNKIDAQTGTILPNNCTIIELSPLTTVAYSRRKGCQFPFFVKIDKLTYQFKCWTNLQRYRWICAIRLAIAGKSPEPPPKCMPTQYDKVKSAHKEARRGQRSRQSSRSDVKSRSSSLASNTSGLSLNSHDSFVNLEDEDELNHSSSAVRLHKSKDALLLTNKTAFSLDRLSRIDNDLEIIDIDDDSEFAKEADGQNVSEAVQRLDLNEASGSNAGASLDSNAGFLETSNAASQQSYRLYPDNTRSYSWTSLSVTGKKPTHRQHSAPSSSQRYQKYGGKPQPRVTFSEGTK